MVRRSRRPLLRAEVGAGSIRSASQARKASDIAHNIAETLVAFANADGELVVGMEDDGSVSGVPHADDKVHLLLGIPKDRNYLRHRSLAGRAKSRGPTRVDPAAFRGGLAEPRMCTCWPTADACAGCRIRTLPLTRTRSGR
ncbi:MAG: ATP-binding protein [Kiritimatiellia bacterium]